MYINAKQKKIIATGVVAAILMCLIPPWKHTFKRSSIYSEEPAGYYFILDPPERKSNLAFGLKLDLTRLSIQWVMILLGTGLGVFLTATTKEEDIQHIRKKLR